jgi:hypothetical protein
MRLIFSTDCFRNFGFGIVSPLLRATRFVIHYQPQWQDSSVLCSSGGFRLFRRYGDKPLVNISDYRGSLDCSNNFSVNLDFDLPIFPNFKKLPERLNPFLRWW